MKIGTPYSKTAIRVMLLGSGELGKEVAIELIRLGVEVHACDSYPHAPAMQVAQHSHVFDMLDERWLNEYINLIKPHYIVPEVEAIATQALTVAEREGVTVIPNAKAINAIATDIQMMPSLRSLSLLGFGCPSLSTNSGLNS